MTMKRILDSRDRQRLIAIYCRMVHEANLLWINSDSSYNFHEAWLRENFRKNERGQIITVKSDNVLEPAVINKVNQLDGGLGDFDDVSDVCDGDGGDFDDVGVVDGSGGGGDGLKDV